MDHQKKEIRERSLRIRDDLPSEKILEWSRLISSHLSVLPEYTKSRIVLFYYSHKSEVNTHEMIASALLSKKVLLPKMSGGQIVPSLILSTENLISGYGGILEPIEAFPVKLSSIDCVIVPGIAFDLKGGRIGSGKGFYDRLLSKMPHAIKIGLCFEDQIVENIPLESHDVRMDIVVTEKRAVLIGRR